MASTLKAIHVSDTHGCFLPLGDVSQADVIIHSGDGLPNATRGGSGEAYYQRNWIAQHAKQWRAWIGDRPFLYCRGNHDFIDPVDDLRAIGIDAYSISNNVVVACDVSFYGVPQVPSFCGEWSGECHVPEMRRHIDAATALVNAGGVDVLVCHAPPHGILDWCGEHAGNTVLANAMAYEWTRMPRALLCGHIHEGNGVQHHCGMTISNAACGYRVVSV